MGLKCINEFKKLNSMKKEEIHEEFEMFLTREEQDRIHDIIMAEAGVINKFDSICSSAKIKSPKKKLRLIEEFDLLWIYLKAMCLRHYSYNILDCYGYDQMDIPKLKCDNVILQIKDLAQEHGFALGFQELLEEHLLLFSKFEVRVKKYTKKWKKKK